MPAEFARHTDRVVSIALYPNRSLSPRALRGLLFAFGGAACVLAVPFAAQGLWPVAAFVALEFLAVLLVAAVLRRHRQDCDLVLLDERQLEIVHRRCYRESRHVFPRPWARLVVEPAAPPWRAVRLCVRALGREVELGAGLGEDERLALARQLKAWIPLAAAPAAADLPLASHLIPASEKRRRGNGT